MYKLVKDAISRRSFLQAIAVGTGGLGLALSVNKNLNPLNNAFADAAKEAAAKFDPSVFVKVGKDNKVRVLVKHLEMGQGTFTGLSTLVAEELDADWSQIEAEAAPADPKIYNNLFWGPNQGTGGSTAIANSYIQMRQIGAAVRQMIVSAAAEKWQVPAADIKIESGVVMHGGHKATLGQLAELAAAQPIPNLEQLKLKSSDEFKLIGQTLERKDLGKTDGTAVYTQDINLPNMLVAMVAHPPRFGAKLASFDASAATEIKGVANVVEIPSGVAVLAKDYWTAKKGRDALKVNWDENSGVKLGSAEIMAQYKELAKNPGKIARNDGKVDETAFTRTEQDVSASYEFPFLAHAAMEPMNCVVDLKEDSCHIINGDQLQTLDQVYAAKVLGLRPDQVYIQTTFAGGSFGRRANPQSDYLVEAVSIAKAINGSNPVKLVWSREDDMRAGYFRPMYYHTLRAGLDKAGNILAWEHRIVGQSIAAGTPFEGFLIHDGIDHTSVEGASDTPYTIPNLKVSLHTTDVGIPIQWWRSVGATHTAYAVETFIDELAEKAGKDPVAYRLKMLAKSPRHAAVLKLAAAKANWDKPLPKGHFRGIALHKSFSTYVAQVAEISIDKSAKPGQFKVERVTCAVDCGIAINPDVIKAQMEGGIGYGLSATLTSEITLNKGQVVESNFHDYEVLRMRDMPTIDVHIVDSAESPTGVGEPGTPVVAPAVANAYARATRSRSYRLPMRKYSV